MQGLLKRGQIRQGSRKKGGRKPNMYSYASKVSREGKNPVLSLDKGIGERRRRRSFDKEVSKLKSLLHVDSRRMC